MRPVIGLLQNYEVMLLFVLLLLIMQFKQGEEALDISVDSGQEGDLSAKVISGTAQLQKDQLEFNGQVYRSSELFVNDLAAAQINTIALQSSPQVPLEKLFDWMEAISAAGINIQVLKPKVVQRPLQQ